jgi:hypothetical protein
VEHTGSFFGDGSLGFYDDGRTSGPLEDWTREVLIQALIDQGCPGDIAPALAEHANLRTGEGLAWELDVHSALYLADSTQVSREEFSEAARGIAEDLRQQSADIRDARRRGEQWLDPYWDVPDQGPRM